MQQGASSGSMSRVQAEQHADQAPGGSWQCAGHAVQAAYRPGASSSMMCAPHSGTGMQARRHVQLVCAGHAV